MVWQSGSESLGTLQGGLVGRKFFAQFSNKCSNFRKRL